MKFKIDNMDNITKIKKMEEQINEKD